MLEAVSSTLLNAGNINSAAPKNSQIKAPQPPAEFSSIKVDPYLSRNVEFQVDMQRAILQIRDTQTGSTIKQFPTESQIRAYKQLSAARSEKAEVDFIDSEQFEAKPKVEFKEKPLDLEVPKVSADSKSPEKSVSFDQSV